MALRVCLGKDLDAKTTLKVEVKKSIQRTYFTCPFSVPLTPTAVYGHSGQPSSIPLLWILYGME